MNDLFNDPTAFIIPQFNASTLDAAFIQSHCAPDVQREQWAYGDLQVVELETNFVVMTGMSSIITFPEVTIQQSNTDLALHCPCPAPNTALCVHQAQALYNISYRHDIRIFFDEALRIRTLKQYASPYGMQDEPSLQDHFKISYVENTLQITPTSNKVFALTPASTKELQELLLPAVNAFRPKPIQDDLLAPVFVVVKRHKYYKHICTEMYSAETTAAGGLKNPLQVLDPMSFVWQTDRADELKFYTGIAKFQNNIATQTNADDLEGLRAIVKNPLRLRFFAHNSSKSENIVAPALEAISFGETVHLLSIRVVLQEPFYHITASVTINEKEYPLQDLKIRFDYFIQLKDTLHLAGQFHFLKVIEFFRQHRFELLVHTSKFADFQQEILSKLEDIVSVHYPKMPVATKKLLAEKGLDKPLERIIYLSDLDNYIMINPVIKYGAIEVPVRTKRVLHLTDGSGKTFTFYRNDAAELAFITLLLKQHPDFESQLENPLLYFYLRRGEFLDDNWFLDAFEHWQQAGITVLGFNQLKENRFNPNKANIAIVVTSGINWFNTKIDVTFGKRKASVPQLHKAIRNKSRFVQLDDGTDGILPAEWIERFADYFNAGEVIDGNLFTAKTNFSAVSQLYNEADLDNTVKKELSLYESHLSNTDTIDEVPVPAALQGTLRAYQQQGLNWLNFLDDLNFGGCLADDMGLGKSIQIIAFILSQREKVKHNTNLLVVPTSLIFNWEAEVKKFAPSIKLHTLYGAGRVKQEQDFSQYELVLTSYGTLLSDVRFLKKYTFNYIFLDESQLIKNPASQRYKAARLLQSRNKIVITGTPVENNTFDLYGQLSFACPGMLGSKRDFRDVYVIPIDKFKDGKRAVELQKKVAPFILRRTKQEVAAELPEKTEMVLYCPMGDEQWKVYQYYEKEFRDFMQGLATEDMMKNAMHIFSSLTKLRQICNSPTLLKEEKLFGEGAAKIEMLVEQIENKSPQHKILVFSQFVGMLDLVRTALDAKGIRSVSLTGSTRNREAVVNAFQEDKSIRVFLISLKAGGIGLNLTAADYVYLVDPWWNPAVENQAIDRIYRIGQKKNVVAVRLICPGTIEEKLMKLQDTKKELAGTLIKSDNDILQHMTKGDLLSLLG